MSTRTVKTAIAVSIAAAVITMGITADVKAWTFYIDEVTDYPRASCPNASTLNTITLSLANTLLANGRTGNRYVNTNAWATDFYESCYNTGATGSDNVYADNGNLTVFAGHGSIGGLWFGTIHNNECATDFVTNMRLGSMGGAQSGFAMYLVCDALEVPDGINASSYQWLKQQFGFQNTVSIGDNEPRDFYNATTSNTGGTTNNVAWLNQMGNNGRHAIVVTQDDTADHCWASHSTYRLAGSVGMYPAPRGGGPVCQGSYPSFVYCWETR